MTALTGSRHAGDDGVVAFVDALETAQGVLRGIGEQALSDVGGGVTTTQMRLLERLSRLGESRLIDLADALSIAPSTATRLCDTLADRQLIVRHRRGRDRRELQIRLTDAGTRLLQAVRERTAADWEEVLSQVSEDDRRQVVAVLTSLAAARSSTGKSSSKRVGLSA